VIVVGVVVVGVGVLAEWRSGDLAAPSVWLPDLLVGVVLAVVGGALLVGGLGWVGWPMIAAGVTWFAGNFAGEPVEWIAWGSGHLTRVHRALILVALLAFPFGLGRRRVEWVVAVAGFAAVLPTVAADQGWTVAWAVSALVSFAVVLQRRTALLRAAGRHVLVVMTVFSFVLVVTSVMLWRLGDAPPPRSGALVYQAGLVLTAVLLLERTVEWRRRAAAVADAVVEITLGPGGNVRSLLSRALRDPSVEVAFATREDGEICWVDEAGRPVERLSGTGQVVVPISVDGVPVAEVASAVDLSLAPALLEAVASATRLAAEHARLRADLRSQIELLGASRRRLLSVADEERVALAVQLEREAGRTLLQVRTLLAGMATTGDARVNEARLRSVERLDGLERDLDSLAAGLGPEALARGRLDEALDQLAASCAVPVTLTVNASTAAMSPPTTSTLYFVCAEAIANATKHAAATTVRVSLDPAPDRWVLTVSDDGCGGANVAAGSGLARLVDRVGALGGQLQLDSPVGAGTRLTVELPRG
jgi:signal transduction histidine kinase